MQIINKPFNIHQKTKYDYIKYMDTDEILFTDIIENVISKYLYAFTSTINIMNLINDIIEVIMVFFPDYADYKYLNNKIKF